MPRDWIEKIDKVKGESRSAKVKLLLRLGMRAYIEDLKRQRPSVEILRTPPRPDKKPACFGLYKPESGICQDCIHQRECKLKAGL